MTNKLSPHQLSFLNPGAALTLSNDEIRWLADVQLVRMPPLPVPIVGDADRGGRSLIDRGLTTATQFTPLGEQTLGPLTQPYEVVVIERVMEDRQRFVWTILVSSLGFAEQVQGPAGCTWLLGGHRQLLGRVLVDAGLMRAAQCDDAAELDPLEGDPFRTAIIVVARQRSSSPATVELAHRDGVWFHECGGRSERVQPRELVERIAAVLSGVARNKE